MYFNGFGTCISQLPFLVRKGFPITQKKIEKIEWLIKQQIKDKNYEFHDFIYIYILYIRYYKEKKEKEKKLFFIFIWYLL